MDWQRGGAPTTTTIAPLQGCQCWRGLIKSCQDEEKRTWEVVQEHQGQCNDEINGHSINLIAGSRTRQKMFSYLWQVDCGWQCLHFQWFGGKNWKATSQGKILTCHEIFQTLSWRSPSPRVPWIWATCGTPTPRLVNHSATAARASPASGRVSPLSPCWMGSPQPTCPSPGWAQAPRGPSPGPTATPPLTRKGETFIMCTQTIQLSADWRPNTRTSRHRRGQSQPATRDNSRDRE